MGSFPSSLMLSIFTPPFGVYCSVLTVLSVLAQLLYHTIAALSIGKTHFYCTGLDFFAIMWYHIDYK